MDAISYNLARKVFLEMRTPPYSAIVCKDGSTVWAENSDGKTIASGESGVDDASVIQSAIDYVNNIGGGDVRLLGQFVGDITVKPKVTLVGYSYNKAKSGEIYGDVVQGTVKVQRDARVYGLGVKGKVELQDFAEIKECIIYSTTTGIEITKSGKGDEAESIIVGNKIISAGGDYGIYDGVNMSDGEVHHNIIAGFKTGIYHTGVSWWISHNHIYSLGYLEVGIKTKLKRTMITNNFIDNFSQVGIQRIADKFESAMAYNKLTTNQPNTVGIEIDLSANPTDLSRVKIVRNFIDAINSDGDTAIKILGVTTFFKCNISDNDIRGYANEGAKTENSGTATFSGDGTTTQFSIAHGLVSAPTKVQVTPMTADAASDFYVTADDTNIYINYKSAPPSGTDNLKFSWFAEV